MHDLDESPDVSICHTACSMTSPSLCQSHDSSVCQPKCDSTWKSSVLSVQPSAKFMVKIPTSNPG